jgi:hypothetical protein
METQIPVRVNKEEIRKVTKNLQKHDVFSQPSLNTGTKEPSSSLDDRGMRNISTCDDSLINDCVDKSKTFHSSKKRSADVIEIAGPNNDTLQKPRPHDENSSSSTDLINVELFDNSSENPIAISDDDSMDEQREDDKFSISGKRKQGDWDDLEADGLPPLKQPCERSPTRLEEELTCTEDNAKTFLAQNPDLKTVESLHRTSDECVTSLSNLSTSTPETCARESPVSSDVQQASSSQANTKERDSFNAVGTSQISTDRSSKTDMDVGEERNTDNIENIFHSNSKNVNALNSSKENDNLKTNMPFQVSSIDKPQTQFIDSRSFASDMEYKEKDSSVSAADKSELFADIMSAQHIPLLERDHSIERTRVRSERTPSKKEDIDKPCSQWKIDLFARYFNFDECVEELELNQHSGQDSKLRVPIDEMVSDFRRRIKIASSTVTKRSTLFNPSNTEETLNFTPLCRTEVGARLILNEIFFPLCSYLDLSVEIERNVDCTYLPNCRFDYRIVNSDGDVIGAVEAKSAGSLRPESVAQAVIELCILQTERLTKKKSDRNLGITPLFNVLTDGVRFVFIVLQGDKLQFEQSFSKICVREITSWDKVKSLYQCLVQLLCMKKNVKGLSEVVEL